MAASPRFTLSKTDLNKIAAGAVVAVLGALLTYAADLLPNVDFGEYTPIVVALLSIAINAGRKFVAGK